MADQPDHPILHPLPLVWGRYEVQAMLGKGASSEVFRADLMGPAGFRKHVALKVLGTKDPDLRQGLLDEARLGARLHHTHLVDTYDVGTMDDRVYIAMELVQGPTLRQLLREVRPFPARATLQLAAQLLRALHYVHEFTLNGQALRAVHRDVKPTNILINEHGEAKLTDLGVASAISLVAPERSETLAGTPGYMAPEQLLTEKVDHRADLFALGIVLVECLAGKRPFASRPLPTYRAALEQTEAALESSGVLTSCDAVIPGVSDLLRRCITRHPQDRWSSASAFAKEVDARLSQGVPGESLFDLVAGDAVPTLLPSVQSLTTPKRTNLPADVDPFFGREREVNEITQRLREGKLLTIQGPGGLGKTRLARQIGRALVAEMQVWFLDLAETHRPDEMQAALAQALGVEADEQAIMVALEQAGDVLIIADNTEQATSAAAQCCEQWLVHPGVRVLVTSRVRLGLSAEVQWDLEPLANNDAVAMFIARAQRVAPRLQDTDALREDVVPLVNALDGMPLALELAAAQARLVPVGKILPRLNNLLDGLRDRQRNRPSRHATLRAAIDGSWQALPGWGQLAFAQLSVFRGGFTLEAAEAVLALDPWPDAPWAMFVVETLLDQSMVRVLDEPSPDGGPRFGLFVPLKAYATEMLCKEEAVVAPDGQAVTGPLAQAGARHRHAAHFHASAVRLRSVLMWGGRGRQTRQELAQELGNIESAFYEVLGTRSEDDQAYELWAAVRNLTEHMGPFSVGIRLGRDLLAAASNDDQRSRDLDGLASLLLRKGEVGEAESLYRHALEVAPDQVSRARSQCNLALSLMHRGQRTEAASLLRAAISNSAGNDALVHAISWLNLGIVLRRWVDMRADAASALQEARKQSLSLGSTLHAGIAEAQLAALACSQGDHEQEQKWCKMAEASFKNAGSTLHTLNHFADLAWARVDQGRYEEAIPMIMRGLELTDQMGGLWRPMGESMLAVCEVGTGDLQGARSRCAGLRDHLQQPNPPFEQQPVVLMALITLAKVDGDQGEVHSLRLQLEQWAAAHPDSGFGLQGALRHPIPQDQ